MNEDGYSFAMDMGTVLTYCGVIPDAGLLEFL